MPKHNRWTPARGPSPKWIVIVVLSVLWVFFVYLGYYTVHKPFTATIILAVLDRLADLALWLALLLLSAVLGRRLLRDTSRGRPLEELVFSLGLGLGILSFGTFLLGIIGLLIPWLFWILLLGLLAFHIRDIQSILRNVREEWQWKRPSKLSLFLASFLCITFVFALVLVVTPPVEWDALVYHLTGPKIYITEGQLVWVPDNFHLNFPALTEMLFTCAMLLKGDILAHLIHLTYGLLTVLAIYSFSRKHFTGHVPLLATVLFTSIPTAVIIATWAYVDLALAFYEFIAFFALMNWFDAPEEKRWLFLGGVFCGMAMSVKYTGVAALIVLSILVLFRLLKKRTGYRRHILGLLALVLIAIVVASPWYCKNAVYTGNPIYPYLFGGRNWNDLRSQWLAAIGVKMSPLQLLLLPWDITILGTQGTEAFDATISPFFLAFLPLILFVRRDHKMLVPLGIFSLIVYLLWIATGAATYSTFVLRTRILLPCFAPLSILTAYVVENLSALDRKIFSLQRFILMTLGLGLAINIFSQGLTFLMYDPLPFIVGIESREDFLRRHLADGHYDALNYINLSLPESAQVLFLWEPRSYYCEEGCLPDTVFDHFSQLASEYEEADRIVEALQREGISHILVNQRWLNLQTHSHLFKAQDRRLFNQFRDLYLEPIYVDDRLYAIYRIDYREP
jgi:hypothetical protein